MKYLVAGSLAAVTAWVLNVHLVGRFGDKAVVLLIPPAEEILKTTAAVALGAPLIATHMTFGLIEAVHDYLESKEWGLGAGILSILGHWLFGKTTLAVFAQTAAWWPAVLAACLAHTLWNFVLVKIFTILVKHLKTYRRRLQ